VVDERDEVGARQRALVDRIRRAAAEIPDVEVVGDPVDRLPHLVTFSCLYVDGEALVTELDRLGYAVASGSACTASTLTPSHVLAAMGALTHGNVRLSLARDATQDQVDGFLDVLPGVVARLRAEVGR
jgi:cysteine desulfurase